MTISVDATTESIRTLTTNPYTFTVNHANTGVMGCILMYSVNGTSNADGVTSVTWGTGEGAISFQTHIKGSDTAGEPGRAGMWILLRENLTSTTSTTISITTGTNGDDYHFTAVTIKGTWPLSIADSDSYSGGDASNPSVTVQPGKKAMAFLSLFSGLSAPSSITDGSGITRLQDHTFATSSQASIHVRQTTATHTDFTFSFTSASDDLAYAVVSISDASIEQRTWRWRNDDGSETTATWMVGSGYGGTVVANTNTKKRLRFALHVPFAYTNFSPILEVSLPVMGLAYIGSVASTNQTGSDGVDSPIDIFFNTDGTKSYVIPNPAYASSTVFQYTHSPAYTVFSMSYASKSFSVETEQGYCQGIELNSTGTKLYTIGTWGTVERIHQYTLSTPWDITTASYDSIYYDFSSLNVVTNYYDNLDFCFNKYGDRIYIGGHSGIIYEIYLSTAWDLTTAVYNNVSYNCGGNIKGLHMLLNGTKLYVITSIFREYNLTTPYDVSTATLNATIDPWWVGGAGTGDTTSPFIRPSLDEIIIPISSIDDKIQKFGLDHGRPWQDVTTTSSYVKATDSSGFNNGATATWQLWDPGGTYTGSNGMSEDGVAGPQGYTDDVKAEVEYAIEFITDDLKDGDVLGFRIKNADVWTDA